MNISEAEWLFLNNYLELRGKVDSSLAYETLSIARILRLLLVDGNTLVSQANSKHRIKLRFKVATESEFEKSLPKGNMISVSLGSFDPASSPPERIIKELSIDQFLKHVICSYKLKDYSILDVIKIESHAGGAVHFNQAKGEAELKLQEASKSLRTKELPRFTLVQLKAIGRITLRALEPLAIRIHESGNE